MYRLIITTSVNRPVYVTCISVVIFVWHVHLGDDIISRLDSVEIPFPTVFYVLFFMSR